MTCVMPTREDTTAHVPLDSGDIGVNSKSDHAETSCWVTKQNPMDCTAFLTKMTSYSMPTAILIRSLISHGLSSCPTLSKTEARSCRNRSTCTTWKLTKMHINGTAIASHYPVCNPSGTRPLIGELLATSRPK